MARRGGCLVSPVTGLVVDYGFPGPFLKELGRLDGAGFLAVSVQVLLQSPTDIETDRSAEHSDEIGTHDAAARSESPTDAAADGNCSHKYKFANHGKVMSSFLSGQLKEFKVIIFIKW